MSGARLAALAAAVLLGLPGCAAVRGGITADDLEGPVSLTPHVYGAEGETLTLGEELEEVAQFATEGYFVAGFYGLAPPWWTWDASDYLNEQLERYDGEAIVDLAVETQEPGGLETLLSYFTQTSPMIPIWMKVKLEGTVVRRSR